MPIKMPQKELDVLSLLLRSEQPMTISDIVAMNPDYTINMIKPIIRKLSKLEMVEVAGIVYRGTSIARTFKPTKTAHLVLQDIFQQEYQSFRELFTDNSLLISLVKSEFTKNPEKKLIDWKVYWKTLRRRLLGGYKIWSIDALLQKSQMHFAFKVL